MKNDEIRIVPKTLKGTIPAITSKSAAHRILICAAIADKPTKVRINNTSADIETTISCLIEMGANIKKEEDCYLVEPVSGCKDASINVRASGSTLRFLLPLASIINNSVYITGEDRLPERPMHELINALSENGVEFSSKIIPYTVSGSLRSGRFTLPGNVSSGYISGLLFALPLLSGDSEIILTSPVQSKGYIEMTINALEKFGVSVKTTENGYFVKGSQTYKSPSTDITEVENDWSNAAFFLAAGAIGESVTVEGLDVNSAQGDKKIIELLKDFGADVYIEKNKITVEKNNLNGLEIDVSDIPDLLPILAVIGACSKGCTVLYNAARLRLKECDRLKAVYDMLSAFGADITEESDHLIINGQNGFNSVSDITVDSVNDHRIAMSAAIAAVYADKEVRIKNKSAVNKSYPMFYNDYIKLGGEIIGV